MTPLVIARIRYYPSDSPKRSFYSSNVKDDYATYIDKGISAGFSYMDYAGNPEKSSGIFNQDGIMTKADKQLLRDKLRTTESNIWDLIISLETDAKDKMDTYKDAYEMVRKCLPKFLKNAGFNPDNVTWYAGLHTNTDNRHVHISFFENEPTFYNAKKKKYCYRKGRVSLDYINDLKADIENHFNIDKASLIELRKILLDEVKDTIKNKPISELQNHLKPYLKRLYADIPLKGKIGYDTPNMDLIRPYVDCVTEILLASSTNREAYYSKLNELEIRDKLNDETYGEGKRVGYAETFRKDLYRRIGNIVIKDIVEKRNEAFKEIKYGSSGKINRKNEYKEISRLLKKTYQLSRQNEYEAHEVFNENLRTLEKAEYDRLVEAGEIDIE